MKVIAFIESPWGITLHIRVYRPYPVQECNNSNMNFFFLEKVRKHENYAKVKFYPLKRKNAL